VVLVAYGIRVDGKREFIDFMATNADSEKRRNGVPQLLKQSDE